MTGRRVSALMVFAFALSTLAVSWSFAQDEGGRGRGRGQDRARGQDRGGRRGFGRGFGGFGGFGRTTNKVTLIGIEQVQKELKLDEKQTAKVSEIVASYREASREFFRFGRRDGDLSREEREKQRAESQKKREALVKKTEKQVEGVLNKEQTKRLNEITLQQRGIRGLTEAPVVASLSLSKEQVEKINGAFTKGDEARTKLFEELRGRGRDGFAGVREKMDEIQKSTEKNVLAVLTKKQSEKYASLKGKPFELDRAAFRGRGGFRGGDRGGRGGDRGGRGGDRGGRGERRRPPADDGKVDV